MAEAKDSAGQSVTVEQQAAAATPPQPEKRGPGRPRKERPATRKVRLHDQYIYGGVWYGPGEVEVSDEPIAGHELGHSLADALEHAQTRVMREASVAAANRGPTQPGTGTAIPPAPVSQPTGPIKDFAGKNILTPEDFHQMAQQSGQAAAEAKRDEDERKRLAREQAEGRSQS